MRRARLIGPLAVAVALSVPPCVTLVTELRRAADHSAPPPVLQYGFGRSASSFTPPKSCRRGHLVPARVIEVWTPSAARWAFFVRFPSGEEVHLGAVAMTQHSALAGLVIRVWPWAGIALIRHIEDPGFVVPCRNSSGERFLLRGRGAKNGLEAVDPTGGELLGEVVHTAETNSVFPGGLLVGFRSSRNSRVITPAFNVHRTTWLYLWRNPDLEALRRAIGLEVTEL